VVRTQAGDARLSVTPRWWSTCASRVIVRLLHRIAVPRGPGAGLPYRPVVREP